MDSDSTAKQPAAREGPGLTAFIDISGFTSLMEAHDSCVPLWQEMEIMRQAARGLFDYGVARGGDPKKGLIFVGDASLVYAFDPDDETMEAFIRTICGMCGVLLHRGWRVRAAVSLGNLCVSDDKAHYLGAAVARAHRLESKQAWFGGALDPELAPWVRETPGGQRLVREGILVDYQVPFKENSFESRLAIGWPSRLSLSAEDLRKNLNRTYPVAAEKAKIDAMLDQTMTFYTSQKTSRQ